MNFVVFDTETTSLDKPFCYNIGYVIINDSGMKLVKKDFVVEQIWHNLPLFSTAYYAEKRPIYVKAMKARKTVMNKFGYICREMIRDFEKYDVVCGYAYNSSFDEKVFAFNCDWFKCSNPFDTIPVYDIRGNVHEFLIDENYYRFCDENNFYTESGCYSSTAENIYRYLMNDTEWNEDHTALSDSEIESNILMATVLKGAKLNMGYSARRSLGKPNKETTLVISTPHDEFCFKYKSFRINKEKTRIVLK